MAVATSPGPKPPSKALKMIGDINTLKNGRSPNNWIRRKRTHKVTRLTATANPYTASTRYCFGYDQSREIC